MAPSWYIASRFSRRFELQGVRADLLRAGHAVTSRWLDDSEDDENLGAAHRDIIDVKIANGLLLFTDEPRCASRGGRHFESLAYALGKKLVGIGERGHIFHLMPEFQWFPDWETARTAITSQRTTLRDVWGPLTLTI
jgi:hypothetical protein